MNNLDYLLRNYQNKRRLSQAALAELLNVRQATCGRLGEMKGSPCLENLKKVCDKLRV